jgi:hypothetical protein
MKAILLCMLSCLSVVAADTNRIQLFTTASTNAESGYLNTVDEFTRGGQTNLIRRTHTRGGVVVFRSQTFYHNGADLGGHIFNGSETIIGSTAGAPYPLSFVFDTSNKPRSAIIGTVRTNAAAGSITIVTLDSFACTNGVFYPRDSSFIREVNSLPNDFILR